MHSAPARTTMHYMALPVSFRWADDFVARIDEARGLVPRSTFVQAAVERVLAATQGGPDSYLGETAARPATESKSGGDPSPASPRAPAATIPSREPSRAELEAVDADLLAGEQLRNRAPVAAAKRKSPRTAAGEKQEAGAGTPLPKIAKRHWV